MKTNMAFIKQMSKQIKERKAELDQRRNKLTWYNWKEKNLLRILPPWEGSEIFFRRVFYHFSLNPAGKNHVCFRNSWSKMCYICIAYGRVWEVNPKMNMRWRNVAYVNAIDRYDEDKGNQIVPLSIGTFNWLISMMCDDDFGDITDPKKGSDLKILKESTGPEAKDLVYKPSLINQGTPIHKDPKIAEKWIKSMYKLDTIFKPPNKEKVQANLKAANDFLADMNLERIDPYHLRSTDKYTDINQITDQEEVDVPDTEEEQLSYEQGKVPENQKKSTAKPKVDTKKQEDALHDGQPECYGMEFDPGSEKCQICPCETDCSDLCGALN